ncbi:MAG: gliding motility-associated ABC transporter substrate-binding protein GldG [Flammeovirgaceae bacterium]|mgnify:CR=1 FL=1|jgi:ABC-2 type transport system permease protein|nr:gliding motility-associated ABC transporter substrate-binding protein GldG [Flammeovirgaceae bacterium]|tara:strand:+ start:7677 stop:9356 length:1680 start_codon:yes stop_codon:yes gene_type:complete
METRKLNHFLIFLVGILGVLLLNQFANRYRYRLDLTEEKRYTLHPPTREVLKKLKEPVTIEVFLEGELPSNFKRLKIAIQETLEQFAYLGGDRIQFRFTDPALAVNTKARNEYFRSLIEKGLQPSNVSFTKEGQKTEKLIFPGAIITYQGRELGLSLLKGNRSISIEEMLNQSIEGVEYELSAGIKEIQSLTRRKIGLITGHGEPDTTDLAGMTNTILSKYDLYRIDLPKRNSVLTGYDVIVLTKPTVPFTEVEKYYLDQFIMNGGNLLVFMDALTVDMSQADGFGTIAVPVASNLQDLFFKYGIRVNENYVADVNCGYTPVYTGAIGEQPRIEMLPWPYSPIITNYGNHLLVKNLDATWFRGASTIDTVKAVGILKTPLFLTSENTKVFSPPVQVSYNDLQDKLRPEAFTSGSKALGYLLEGQFTSLYANRFPPRGVDRTTFREKGDEAKLIVISDGDFIRNDFSIENQNPLPMGMDAYTNTTYANEAFLLNALDYMFDDQGLMLARNKQIKIRPLNKSRVIQEASYWRWLNTAGPLLVLLCLGMIINFFRRRQFASR